MTKLTNLAAAFATIALIGGAGAAHATPQAPDIMVVRLGDLNTSSPKGAETALRRIKQAAKAFCGPPSREVGRYFEGKACEKRMTNVAVSELDAPLVTALNSHAQPIRLAQSGTPAR